MTAADAEVVVTVDWTSFAEGMRKANAALRHFRDTMTRLLADPKIRKAIRRKQISDRKIAQALRHRDRRARRHR